MRLAPFLGPAALLLVVAGGIAACSSTPPYLGDTGLRGQVLRGPVQPVCQQGMPCDDEPFAASFNVLRGGRRVATFVSGEDGRFEVMLAPGTYTVVPGADAPMIAPEQQMHEVQVADEGLTEVALHFDTGIRQP